MLLRIENPIAFIAHQDGEAHALFLLFGEILLRRLAVVVGEDDFAAFDRKAHGLAVLLLRLHRRRERRIRGRIAASFAKSGERFFYPSGKVFRVARDVKLLAELAASLLDFAENLFRISDEIGIHRVPFLEGRGKRRNEALDVLPAFGRRKDALVQRFAGGGGKCAAFPAKDEDVSRDGCAGSLEGIARKAKRRHEIGLLGETSANLGARLVHRAA